MEPGTGRPSERRTEHSGADRSDEPAEVVGAPIPDVMPPGAVAVAGMTADWLDHPLKRVIDLAVAGPAFLVALPVMLLIAVAIRLDSPGSALFRQARVGRGGRSFLMLKFRTMQEGAEEALEAGLPGDPAIEATWRRYQKLMDDPRVTRVGRLLRRWSLDELPQLWNVLRGEMTLVGARPILPKQRSDYGPAFEAYTAAPPGLTGLWQVSGRSRLSFLDRVECDERYRRSCSLGLDLRILLRTVVAVASRDGAW